MKEELNLMDILKDCPKGYKLYSTIFGCVDFEYIDNEEIIVTNNISGDTEIFNQNGSWHYGYTNECMLFPAKDQRDWSKFKIEPEMVDGEIYYAKTDLVEWIYIYKKTHTFKTSHYVAVLNNYFNYCMEFNSICTTQTDNIKVLRKATEEEKRLFFEIIEKNGRKWDADRKELVKAEPKSEPKFDKIKDLHLESLDKAYNAGYNDAMQNALKWLEICLHYHDCGDYDTVALCDDTIEDAIERFKEDNSLKKTNL